MGVSENRGPWYGTLSTRILTISTPPNKVPQPYGNCHIEFCLCPTAVTGSGLQSKLVDHSDAAVQVFSVVIEFEGPIFCNRSKQASARL